jgi:xanthine dehydrogenase YagS FAD-binding subunit
VPVEDFHRLPGVTPDVDTNIQPGEMITSVDLPASSSGLRSSYRKVRDRASYAFALVSVAAAVRLEGGQIADVRIALGGVAHKPWRARAAERLLAGARPAIEVFAAAADAETCLRAPTATQRLQDSAREADHRVSAGATDGRPGRHRMTLMRRATELVARVMPDRAADELRESRRYVGESIQPARRR